MLSKAQCHYRSLVLVYQYVCYDDMGNRNSNTCIPTCLFVTTSLETQRCHIHQRFLIKPRV